MKKQVISVIGLGFVGFPTACILANCKNKNSKDIFQVNGIDKKLSKIKKEKFNFNLKTKISYEDKNLNKILKNIISKKKINFSNKIKTVSNSDIIIISISFDFNNNNSAKKFNELRNLFKQIATFIKKKSMILMETTVPPGTCDNVVIPTLKKTLKKRGMKFVNCLKKASIEYEQIVQRRKVWVFKNVNNEKIELFKKTWLAKI